MVIGDFDVVDVFVDPFKSDTPLTVDTDAVLSLPVAVQGLEVIRREPHEVVQRGSDIEDLEPPDCLLLKKLEFLHTLPAIKRLGSLAAERSNHAPAYHCYLIRKA